jgi:hypothetical protein
MPIEKKLWPSDQNPQKVWIGRSMYGTMAASGGNPTHDVQHGLRNWGRVMIRIGIGCVLVLLIAGFSFAKEEIPPNIAAGKQVEKDARLTVGTKLVGIWDKKSYLVDVLEIKPDKQIRIHWIGFDKSEDIDVPPSELYYPADTNQTRKSGSSKLPKEYQALDKNNDGQIGLYEWERSKYAEFRKLDKNHDGFLTPQELTVKVAVAVATATTPTTTTTPSAALPDPGNLENYKALLGQSFTFSVTGKTAGNVIGTELYSTTSDLAAAAVHAAVLKDGVTGNVTVTILSSPETFKGSVANGVTSTDGAATVAAFSVKAP